MAQLLIRQLDEDAVTRLKLRAKERKTSVEALARDAVHRAAKEMTVEEKRALIRRTHAATEMLKAPGVEQTPGWLLIREDRDGR